MTFTLDLEPYYKLKMKVKPSLMVPFLAQPVTDLPLTQNDMTISQKSAATSKRRVWRYQRGNQNPYIEEEQTTQWPKEKVQNDKQQSTKTYT